MKDIVVYEAVSRVASNNEVIGFMVVPMNKKGKEVYMSIEVISFGLSQKTFEIRDVKISSSGKPRGCNGFLLSKLPVIDLNNGDDVNLKLYRVLLFIVKELGVDKDIKKMVKFNKVGIMAHSSVRVCLSDYKDMNLDVANEDLNKILKFYLKHLPKDFKGYCEKIEGTVEEKGYTVLTVSKSLVREEKKK